MNRLMRFARYIRHDIAVQKDYLASYLLAFAILLTTFFIDNNQDTHKVDGSYWIAPLENVFNVSFRNIDMTPVIFTFGILISSFAFVIGVMIKRASIEKNLLVNQIEVQEARDDLLALASHQLRTPATGVKQYLGIIRDGMAGNISAKQKKLVDEAYFYNEQQLRIINDFLYMAKLDAERVITHPAEFDLIELTEEVIRGYEYIAEEKQISIKLKAPNELVLYSDKQCLRMCIENILSNAIKYTNIKGQVSITISKQDVIAVMVVEDNGVGIHRKDRRKLFKKFSRIDNPLSSQEGGSGIGLYIAKKLIELNHGEISYKPTVDGSKFTLELPL